MALLQLPQDLGRTEQEQASSNIVLEGEQTQNHRASRNRVSQYLGEAALPPRTRLTKLPAIARPLELAAAAMQRPAVRERRGGKRGGGSHHSNSESAVPRRGQGREVERVRWVFNSVDSLLPYRLALFIAPGAPPGGPAACAVQAPPSKPVQAHRRTAPAIAIGCCLNKKATELTAIAALDGNLCRS